MNDSRDYGALVLRVTLGLMFLSHALLKLLVFTPAGTAKFFASLGLPGPLAYLTILVELAGAVALILGVFIRIVTPVLALVLAGTIVLVHGANGFFFTNAGGGWEYPAFWIAALAVQYLIGAGAFALKLSPSRLAAA